MNKKLWIIPISNRKILDHSKIIIEKYSFLVKGILCIQECYQVTWIVWRMKIGEVC